MKIMVEITLDSSAIGLAKAVAPGLKGQRLTNEHIEETLVHNIVSDVNLVTGAVIMRNTIPTHPLGWQRYEPDEDTRQER
jgi:hypothetical protein